MTNFLRLAAALLFAFCAPAAAQWQTPVHSVPIGQGTGVIGYGAAIPGTAGQPLISNGASLDPSFGALQNSGLATAPANTAKCNPTGATASVQDCTIAQLVTMGLAPSASVVSYGADHTLTQSDCNQLIIMSGGQFTATLPAANTITGPCAYTIVNGDTGRGKKLASFPTAGLTSPSMLWPSQVVQVTDGGSTWIATKDMGPWVTAGVSFFVNAGGSNSNDGLAAGTSNAFATLQFCISAIYSKVYDSGSSGQNCKVAAGTSITEYVQVYYPVPGSGIVQIQSDTPGTQFTWNCPASLPCMQFGDYAGVGLTDINFVANASSPEILFGHQYGVTDINTNVKFTGASGAQPLMSCDYMTQWNMNNGITYAGTAQLLFYACSGSVWNINGAITASASPTLGRFFSAAGGAHVWFQGNTSFPGSVSTSIGLISGNSVVGNFSGTTLPGGNPTPTSGGQLCTSAC